MRTIKLEGGAASVEGHVVVVHATQEGSNEVIKVEIPAEVFAVIQEAVSKGKKKGAA